MLREEQLDVVEDCVALRSGGVCLPLGFGKTLVGLEIGKRLKTTYPTLIICSNSLMNNWTEHITKFYPNSTYYNYNVDYKKKKPCNLDEIDYFIITPDTVSSEKFFDDTIKSNLTTINPTTRETTYIIPSHPLTTNTDNFIYYTPWSCLIIDEIQNHNNVLTDKCQAIIAIYSPYKFGLSGTIIDNVKTANVLGYNLLIGNREFPNTFHSADKFIKSSLYTGIKSTCIIRDVDSANIESEDIVIDHEISMLEESLFSTYIIVLKKILKYLKELKSAKEKILCRKYRQYLLSSLVYLRQMAVSPLIPYARAILSSSDLSNRSHLSQLMNEELSNNNLLSELEDESNIYSSRIKACIKQLQENTERVVIFSSFRVSLNLLIYCIHESLPTRTILTIDGDMTIFQRDEVFDKFNNDETAILLLTYTIGSVGLNLQCSNVVYILDYNWSAVSTKQAIQRVVRRGQEKKCYVYYFTSKLSIEESILNKQIGKLNIGKGLFNGDQRLIASSSANICLEEVLGSFVQQHTDSHAQLNTIKDKINNLQK